MMRFLSWLSLALLFSILAVACGRPVIDRSPVDLPADDPVDIPDEPVDDPVDEPVDDPVDEPVDDPVVEQLALTVRFREPGEHVVLNAQAGATTGDLYLVTLPSEEVSDPFELFDDAVEGALAADARIAIDSSDTSIIVTGAANSVTTSTGYAVAQAGPLPIEVCAVVEGDALIAQLRLECASRMTVEGFGITAITASYANTDTWCNMLNLNGDTSLIPFTNPTVAVRNIEVVDGKACWPLDIHVGANGDDDGGGTQQAEGTFTFTAALP